MFALRGGAEESYLAGVKKGNLIARLLLVGQRYC